MKGITSFISNVGLITSNGPHGHNIMSAEWTYQISYEPHLVAICIRKTRITAENILVSKEFGVSLAAFDQNVVSSIAGNHHGDVVDKIAVLKERGVKLHRAKNIDVLLVEGSATTIECKLVQVIDIGDHPIFIGAVVEYTQFEKEPITYHAGKYYKIGENVPKPGEEVLSSIHTLVSKHTKDLPE